MLETKPFYNGKNDVVFKAVMTRNKKILKTLIETIIGEEVIIEKIKNSEKAVKNVRLRKKVVDLLVKAKDKYIHIELNVNNEKYYKVRNVSYIFDSYSNSVEKGKDYSEKIDFIGIDLTYGLKDKNMMNEYRIMDKERRNYVNNFKIIECNMDKIMDVWYSKDNKLIDKYKYLIMLGLDRKDLKELSRRDDIVKEFNEEVEELNEDPVFVRRITPEQDQEFIENTIKYYAREEGLAEGREEGLKEGTLDTTIKIVKNMLNENIDVNIISKVTGLSIDEINKES